MFRQFHLNELKSLQVRYRFDRQVFNARVSCAGDLKFKNKKKKTVSLI